MKRDRADAESGWPGTKNETKDVQDGNVRGPIMGRFAPFTAE